jgi:glycosyltransferase involved in cell wall biosynthesis
VRILIVYNTVNDARSVSGVQRHFAGVTADWITHGHTVDFLVARAAWPVFQELYPRSRLISSDNLFDATGKLAQTWRNFPAYAWRMLTCHGTRFPERYDVVFACGQAIFETYAAKVIAQRLKAVLAVKVHHVLATQRPPKSFFDRLFLLTERWSTRLLHRHADLIIVSTPPITADFAELQRRLGLLPRPVQTIGYGLDLQQLRFAPDSPKRFDAVLLGRVHEHKGVFDAPSLWQAVRQRRPDARLLVVGEGAQRAELQRRFAALGLTPDNGAVTFTGGIPDSEKDALLPQCRVGLSLSREEGWGLSITEYLAFGLPVVAMHLPIFDQVFPEQLDLVPLGDTAAAAVRVLHWLEHPDQTRTQAVRGRAFVERYDYRSIAAAELAALERAVDDHSLRASKRPA